MKDLKLALRTLRKSPIFTLTAIVILALGIGANTAIFQLLDAVRLRSLPVMEPGQLASVQIQGGNQGFGINVGSGGTQLTYPLWEQIRRGQRGFSGIFAWAEGEFRLGEGLQERQARGLWIGGPMFATLGLTPLRGRFFSEQEDQPGCGTPGAVISYALWQSEFGGQDSAIGSNLMIQGRSTPVIGVTPASFFGLVVGNQFDFIVPFCSSTQSVPGSDVLTRKDYFWPSVLGRLKPGWTLQQASAQLQAISPGIFQATEPSAYSSAVLDQYRSFQLAAYPAGNGISSLRDAYDKSLYLLLGITGLVLLIACANLANLMLARAMTRTREMAVRLALGASRSRLVDQLLAEGLVLAAGGAILGTLVARIFSSALVRLLATTGRPLELDLSIDWRVLAFTSAMAIITCLVFSLAPAFRSSHVDPGIALKMGSRGTTSGREQFSFQRTLVVSQIAVSLVLMVGALLFVHSFLNLVSVDPGLRQKGIVITQVNLRRLHLPPERFEQVGQDVLAQIRSLPQVDSAATATIIPLTGNTWTLGVHIGNADDTSMFTWASPEYFTTMGIPLLSGRDFSPQDTVNSPRVAIVNETFVRRFFGGENPEGKVIRTKPEPNFPEAEYQIVGVTKDTKYSDLRQEIPPMSFAPASQYPAIGPWENVFIRSAAPTAVIIGAVREKLREFNPEIRADFHVLQNVVQDGMVRERMMAMLSGFFGVLAVLLATVGLYGIISYIVAMRKNEIGIRMALGASRRNVAGIVVKQTLQLVSLGIAAGVALSLVAAKGAGSLLFGLRPYDPLTLVVASVFLGIVALLASYLPALRASRLNPMQVLREE
ncbi:MAG TPA: ABC transporter permease [Candidatus Acidoferrum sp.]